ncbi:hypothetical protein BV898_18668, partial [Hypsibius exemplaris]
AFFMVNTAVVFTAVLLGQGCLCVVAIRTKVRLIKCQTGGIGLIRQVSCLGADERRVERERRTLERTRWALIRSVFGASSVVVTAWVFTLPAAYVYAKPSLSDSNPLLISWVYLLVLARDIPPILIYTTFYPQYRATLKRFCSPFNF